MLTPRTPRLGPPGGGATSWALSAVTSSQSRHRPGAHKDEIEYVSALSMKDHRRDDPGLRPGRRDRVLALKAAGSGNAQEPCETTQRQRGDEDDGEIRHEFGLWRFADARALGLDLVLCDIGHV